MNKLQKLWIAMSAVLVGLVGSAQAALPVGVSGALDTAETFAEDLAAYVLPIVAGIAGLALGIWAVIKIKGWIIKAFGR